MRQRLVWALWDTLAFLAVLAAGWKFGLPADRWFDIPAFDEARYLNRGVELLHIGLTQLPSEWSPLYSLWYHLLYRLGFQDRIALYYLNFRLLGALLPALFFLVLRRYGVSYWAAFALAIYAVGTRLSWVTDTRVTSFALMLVFLTAWLLTFLPPGWPRTVVAAVSMVVVAYARPEYLMAAGLLALVALVQGGRAWRREKRRHLRLSVLVGLAGSALLAVGSWVLWGPPVGKGRSMYAFGQHFAYTRWFCLKQPHRGISWEDEVRADFGDARTILEAFMANPRAFGSHIWCNLKTFPPRLGSTLFLHAAYFFPKGVLAEALLFAGLTALGMLGVVLRDRTTWPQRLRARQEALLFWGIMSLVGLSVLMVIHGAKRYYLILLGWPTLVLGALFFLPSQTPLVFSRRRVWTWLTGLLLGMALVPPMGYMTPYPWNPPFLENLELLKTLRALPLPTNRPVRWVSVRGLRHYFLMLYLNTEFEALPYAPEEGFLDYIQETQPDILTVDRRWFQGDATWRAFLEQPQRFGYWKQKIGPYRWLFGRGEIIPPP